MWSLEYSAHGPDKEAANQIYDSRSLAKSLSDLPETKYSCPSGLLYEMLDNGSILLAS